MNIHRYKNDWLIAICLVVFLMSVYGSMVYIHRSSVKIQQLTIELRALRSAVAVFYEINGRVPRGLDELAGSVYYRERQKAEYLNEDLKSRVLSGKFVDPFGNVYIYDPATGKINTKSESKLDATFK